MKITFTALIFFYSSLLFAQSLQLKEIMKGKDFIGYWPENQAWHVSGEHILFDWQQASDPESKRYAYVLETQKMHVLGQQKRYDYVEYDLDQAEFSHQYFSSHGDLARYNKETKVFELLISSSDYIWDIQRMADPNKIAYRQGDNIFLYDVSKASITQLSHFSSKDEPRDASEETNLLGKQQEELFLFIQEKKEFDKFQKEKVKGDFGPKKIYIGKKRIDFLKIDPTGKQLYYALADRPSSTSTHVEHHIAADGYTYSSNARPKVGRSESNHDFFIYQIESKEVKAVSASTLSNIRQKPEFLKLYDDSSSTYEIDREIVFHSPTFARNGEAVLDIRSFDNKDRWIVHLSLGDTVFNELERQHDDAWIGGPGISSWNFATGTLGWMKDGKQIYYQSEETGYSHLYSMKVENKEKRALTKGNFEIRQVSLSKDGSKFFIHANRSHPGKVGFYILDWKKNSWVSIAEHDGAFNIEMAPDEKDMAILKSSSNEPWELSHGNAFNGIAWRKITHSTLPRFENYKWRKAEVITFKGADQQDVYSRIYKPAKEKSNGAAVIFVHGAGYLQNAHYFWSNYYREYMFHNLLTDLGYTVLDIDYRASDGYGRDYRTAIYRHMGGWDLKDQMSGRQYLIDSLGIDAERVGIYGGSYGGFITLMALLTEPGKFACGAALRSVTDWAHYNHEYTSNILNLPENDPKAYRRSSPIYFAENLEDPLVMLHGMVDDNVQFQDVVRLSQRFIELEKENWELAIFPVEAHSFVKAYSWHDEYRRILEMFNENLLK
jgi:dipeptidyl aminopeptidase/acylaminoacyl peptidase